VATFGNTATPGTGFFFDTRSNTQYGSLVGTFPGGYITDINVYIAGDGGSTTVKYGIWGSGGTLLWSSAGHTIGGGSRAIHGQAWQTNGVSGSEGPGLYLAAGSSLRFGIWAASGVVWTYEGSGTTDFDTGESNITSFASDGTDGGGALGVYVDYIPVSAPTISGVSPSVGTAGQTVTITGTGFTYANNLTINGATVTTYTINSDTSITATVPSGATPGAGTLVVANDAGSASIAFTVGQVRWGDASGNGTVHSIVAVKFGDASGNGTVHNAVGIWVPVGSPPTGVKRVW
jgi:hypothetical protein